MNPIFRKNNDAKELGFELLTITNPRFFGALSILPIIQVISTIWSTEKSRAEIFGLLIQLCILILLVKIRSSVAWALILIYCLIIYKSIKFKKLDIRSILVALSIPLLFSLYNFNYNYDNKNIIKNHLVWHNQFISLVENPTLAKIFLERYGVNGGDEVGFKAVEKLIKDEHINQKDWIADDGIRWPYSPEF
jgi:hypothetical protein